MTETRWCWSPRTGLHYASVQGHHSSTQGRLWSGWLALLGQLWLALVYVAPAWAQAQDNAWLKAPLHLPDLSGQPRQLEEWGGKVILLNFWATWCAPCQAEIPRLIRCEREYRERGLRVVGVGLDEVPKLRNLVRTLGVNYPVLVTSPTQGIEILKQWGNRSATIPFTVVIGRDGHIELAYPGIFDEEAFVDYVLPLLEQQ
jgi:thiol-disulfide isomerase/thioredoxin